MYIDFKHEILFCDNVSVRKLKRGFKWFPYWCSCEEPAVVNWCECCVESIVFVEVCSIVNSITHVLLCLLMDWIFYWICLMFALIVILGWEEKVKISSKKLFSTHTWISIKKFDLHVPLCLFYWWWSEVLSNFSIFIRMR